eukprot:gene2188-5402_t
MSRYKPSLTREYDLEGDGTCVGDIAEAAGYSSQATWDWTFTMGVQAVACPHAFRDPDWDTSVAYGGLVGCSKPQPFYTLEWSEWTSTAAKECGGTEVRMQIEVCADTSLKKDCPCTGRRDPALLQRETRENTVGGSIGGGGGACSSSITYATAAPAGPSDAYDGVTYNSMPLRSNANANMNDNAGVQYRPIYDTNGKHDNAGVQYRPIYGTNGKHDNAGVQYRPIYDTNGKHDNAGVQYRPIYDTSANGGGQDDGRGGGVNGGSSTYKTVGAAAAAPAVPANTNNYAQPLSKSNRPTPHAPTLPVRRATKRAKCERPSPKGGTCKTPQRDGSHFCTPHACPADGCGASKSSSEEYCPLHATSGSGSGSSGISRKARDGSTYDGFGGAGNVDHYGSSAESSKGVVHGQETVYAGFNEDEEV